MSRDNQYINSDDYLLRFSTKGGTSQQEVWSESCACAVPWWYLTDVRSALQINYSNDGMAPIPHQGIYHSLGSKNKFTKIVTRGFKLAKAKSIGLSLGGKEIQGND